jgi:hypothetical protein
MYERETVGKYLQAVMPNDPIPAIEFYENQFD